MRARIEDVAAAAAVSAKTVSRVFNAEPNVREETRQRVMAAAESLNYRPNASARSLASNRSYQICLLYQNTSAYTIKIIQGLLDACEQQRYGTMLRPISFSSDDRIEVVEDMLSQYRPDGLVLMPPLTEDRALLARLKALSVPYTRISPKSRSAEIGAYIDDRMAAEEVVLHLAGLGHRRIGHIAGHRLHTAREWRLTGYRDGLEKAGIAFDPALVYNGDFLFDSGVAGTRALLALDDPPTAIFAANDEMAFGVLHEAAEMGRQVPRQLSVFGFDDVAMARCVWPGLSTVHQPIYELGRVATEQLLASLKGQGKGRLVKVPYELVLRRSTGPCEAG